MLWNKIIGVWFTVVNRTQKRLNIKIRKYEYFNSLSIYSFLTIIFSLFLVPNTSECRIKWFATFYSAMFLFCAVRLLYFRTITVTINRTGTFKKYKIILRKAHMNRHVYFSLELFQLSWFFQTSHAVDWRFVCFF